jgi:hypothetical protein
MLQSSITTFGNMEKSDAFRIKTLLQGLQDAVQRWEESDEDWELEEEIIFALTIEYIAQEYYPVGNDQLVEDCIAEVEEVKQRNLRGEPDWLDFHTIMQRVKNGEYGDVLGHIKEMAEIVCKMFE